MDFASFLRLIRRVFRREMQTVLFARSSVARGVLFNAARSYATNGPKKPRLTNTPKPSAAGRPTPPPPPPAPAPVPEIQNVSSSLPSLDIAPGAEEEPQRTGARSSKDSLSSIERRRRFMGRVSLAVLLLGTAVQTWYLGREWEEDELNDRRLVRPSFHLIRCHTHRLSCRRRNSWKHPGGVGQCIGSRISSVYVHTTFIGLSVN